MPELPEVETVKHGLEPVLSGTTIRHFTLHRPDLRFPFPENLTLQMEGKHCLGLRRRGKYIFMDMEGGQTLSIHLGMSGSFKINPETSKPHDHVVIETIKGDKIVYNDPRRFGYMFLVQTGLEHQHPAFTHMGPEPLGNDFNAPDLREILKGKETPIKTALLDQNIIAGLGNIYVCEALYMAGINPKRKACSISLPRLELLVSAIRTVLTDAIASGGSSLRDHRQTDGTMGYFQHSFKVYGKAGHTCPETGGKITRVIQSGRSTFYCAAKQK
jgi:formamidopyrimidine-DNA glycosylase